MLKVELQGLSDATRRYPKGPLSVPHHFLSMAPPALLPSCDPHFCDSPCGPWRTRALAEGSRHAHKHTGLRTQGEQTMQKGGYQLVPLMCDTQKPCQGGRWYSMRAHRSLRAWNEATPRERVGWKSPVLWGALAAPCPKSSETGTLCESVQPGE